MNGKTIDDIINQSDIIGALTAMSADATNVDTKSSFSMPEPSYAQGQYSMRGINPQDLTGVSDEELLGMVMGTAGGGGGAKTLKDLVSNMFKKSPAKATIKHGAQESGTEAWRLLSPDQKKQAADLFSKEFNIEGFKKVQRARKGTEQLLTKEISPIGSVADYMKLTEGRSTLPLQTLPERVSLEIYELLKGIK
tara:strand:- start:13737 stop:14318 length:582 start_codon:yes stop_codon:yes gene_type:complete